MQMTVETSILAGFLALVLLSLIAVMAKALRRRALQNAARLAAPPLPQIDETQTQMLCMLSGIEADVKRMAILQVGLAQRLDAIEKSVNGEKHAPAVTNLLPPPNPSDIAEQSLGRALDLVRTGHDVEEIAAIAGISLAEAQAMLRANARRRKAVKHVGG